MRVTPEFSFSGMLLIVLFLVPDFVNASSQQPAPPPLSLPLACDVGKDCWLVNYFDHDPGPGYKDHLCGPRSYDSHRGIDFAIESAAVMKRGVSVLAAAEGIVDQVRNTRPDLPLSLSLDDPAREPRCGNAVRIDHGKGWATLYCHLKEDSLLVAAGDRVTRGQELGEVGLSGRTVFPHLHFALFHKARAIDPFATDQRGNCGEASQSAWDGETQALLTYRPVNLHAAGLSDQIPTALEVLEGYHRDKTLRPESRQVIFWVDLYGVREGDQVLLSLTGPRGRIARKDVTITKTQARRMIYMGRKRPSDPWPRGQYQGEIQLIRDGSLLLHQFRARKLQ